MARPTHAPMAIIGMYNPIGIFIPGVIKVRNILLNPASSTTPAVAICASGLILALKYYLRTKPLEIALLALSK